MQEARPTKPAPTGGAPSVFVLAGRFIIAAEPPVARIYPQVSQLTFLLCCAGGPDLPSLPQPEAPPVSSPLQDASSSLSINTPADSLQVRTTQLRCV